MMTLTQTPRAHHNRVRLDDATVHKGTGDTQRKVKALPHQLDNEEVNAAEAAAVMRSRGARARAQAVAWGADGGMRSNRVRKSVQVDRGLGAAESCDEYIDLVSIRPDRLCVSCVVRLVHFEHLALREVPSSMRAIARYRTAWAFDPGVRGRGLNLRRSFAADRTLEVEHSARKEIQKRNL